MSPTSPAREQLSFFDGDGLIASLSGLLSVAAALGAESVHGWSKFEERLLDSRRAREPVSRAILSDFRRKIAAGPDPLGDSFARLRSAVERRPMGATYTPLPVVMLMLDWAEEYSRTSQNKPVRIVDPGTGSARFLVAAGRRFPKAELIGVEIDPIAAVLARAHVSAAGMSARTQIMLSDFRSIALPKIDGATLYIGNPPYVRHHLISQQWKQWLVERAASLKLSASQLAGLHVHFFLATALDSVAGDFGAFITAALPMMKELR